MGWFDAGDGVLLSDEATDALMRALMYCRSHYLKHMDREPTEAEWSALLQICLNNLPGAFDENEPKVRVSAKPRKKRRVRSRAGDVFAIPLGDGQHGFGRVLDSSGRGTLVELFRGASESPLPPPDTVDSAHRLMEPILVNNEELFDEAGWPIVYNTGELEPESLESIEFIEGLEALGYEKVDWFTKKRRPISKAEATDDRMAKSWGPDDLVSRILASGS